MLGTFTQLGLLSQYAADIFKGILKEAESSSTKIQSMNARAHRVLDVLENTENYIDEHQTSYNFGEVAKPRHAVEKTSTQMFEQSSRKAALQAQYDGIKYDKNQPTPTAEGAAEEAPRVARTPNFASIDESLDPEMLEACGGTTRRKWSYPEYFVERWVEQEAARQNARKAAKKASQGGEEEEEGGGETVDGGPKRKAQVTIRDEPQVMERQE